MLVALIWLYPGCQRSSRSPAARSVRASCACRWETSGSGSKKSFDRVDPITLPVISPESRFDPGNLIGWLEKRSWKGCYWLTARRSWPNRFYCLSRKTAKANCQTAALISHNLTRNNELAFSSTSNLQFYCFQTLKFFFLDFGLVEQMWKTGSVDQTQLDSRTARLRARKNEPITSNLLLFVSRAVRKVMLVGCDWWFSIRIFL